MVITAPSAITWREGSAAVKVTMMQASTEASRMAPGQSSRPSTAGRRRNATTGRTSRAAPASHPAKTANRVRLISAMGMVSAPRRPPSSRP